MRCGQPSQAHLEAVPPRRLTNRRKDRHTDEEEDTPEHVTVHLPLQLAAFVARPTVVQQRLGLVSCGGGGGAGSQHPASRGCMVLLLWIEARCCHPTVCMGQAQSEEQGIKQPQRGDNHGDTWNVTG